VRTLALDGSPLGLTNEVGADGSLYAQIAFDGMAFKLVGFDLPAPSSATAMAFDCAPWSAQRKSALRAHRAHAVLMLDQPPADASDGLLALLRLGDALGRVDPQCDFLGAVDAAAWNCIAADVLTDMMSADHRAALREVLPQGVCTGFARLIKSPDATWFRSVGLHRWGVVDFAWLGCADDGKRAAAMFARLFDHARRNGARYAASQTMEIDKAHFVFRQVAEFADYLQGPLGTLVIEHVQ
jgi:hypothetical protein